MKTGASSTMVKTVLMTEGGPGARGSCRGEGRDAGAAYRQLRAAKEAPELRLVIPG